MNSSGQRTDESAPTTSRRQMRRVLPVAVAGFVALEVAAFIALGPAWAVSLGVFAVLMLVAAATDDGR